MWTRKKFTPKVTRAEKKLAHALDRAGIHYETQKILLGKASKHCVDFYFAPKLVVEVDGSSHHLWKRQIKDEQKTKDLKEANFLILRFRDQDINQNVNDVVATIKKCLEE